MNILTLVLVLFLVNCFALFVLVPVYLYFSSKLTKELKSNYFDAWVALGELGGLKNNTISDMRKFCKFIERDDHSMNLKYFNVVRKTYYGAIIVFVSAIISMIALAAIK
jgi:hypothetical protein